jgi:hypothetical protein
LDTIHSTPERELLREQVARFIARDLCCARWAMPAGSG